MVAWISSWAEQIIVAVIIGTIIEMILPEGKNKKYIKTVIGVYLLFTMISPVISKFTKKDFSLNISDYLKEDTTYQAMSNSLIESNNASVEEIYQQKLKKDMKNKLLEKGYEVGEIKLAIQTKEEINYGKIESLSITISKKEETKKEESTNTIAINTIQEVAIGNTIVTSQKQEKKETKITETEKKEIQEYLSNTYEINKKKITIN